MISQLAPAAVPPISRWHRFAPAARPLLTNVALLVLGLVYIQFCRDGVREYDNEIHGYTFDVGVQIALFCLGFALVAKGACNKWTLRIVLGVAVAARLVGVLAPAFLSTDVDRYVWDGRVQGVGINPYRYVPSDRHLEQLRDDEVYPIINRKDYAKTIYPPGAQVLFLAVTRIGDTEVCMKLAMVGFEGVACWAMMEILTGLGRRREEILLYAWHPLCMWEIGSSGHLDAVAIGLLMLAALARLRGKAMPTALWVTAATMVKLFPLVLWPALVRHTERRHRLRIMAFCAAIILTGYAAYSSVGAGVFGFLTGYVNEEGMSSGDRYFLLSLVNRVFHVHVWPAAYNGFCVAVLFALAAWAFRSARQPLQAIRFALAIACVLTVLFSPHYAWYFLWLVPFATLAGYLPVIVLTLAAGYFYSTVLTDLAPMNFWVNSWLYSIFVAAVAIDLLVRWYRRHLAHAVAVRR